MELINDFISVEELRACKTQYQIQYSRTGGNVDSTTSAQYADCLSRSEDPNDIRESATLLLDLYYQPDENHQHVLYTLIFTNLKLRNYDVALNYMNEYSDIYPNDKDGRALEEAYDEMVDLTGERNLGLEQVSFALVFFGGLISLGLALFK